MDVPITISELMMTTTRSKLAIAGGIPISPSPLQVPEFPPVSEATAKRLREVYFSRRWSFHSPAEREFAQAYADYHDAKYGVFMANGTVTLHCALEALGVGCGDEVIVPALTWVATAMAVHYVGAKPVFVDGDPSTLCLDPIKAKAAITGKTKAIIPVHLYGSMADMDAFLTMGDCHGVAIIEDCAHMQGGKWNGRGVGSWGKVGSFSFQQSKTISSGEGGICITNDDEIAERLFRIKHIGYSSDDVQGEPQSGPPGGLVCHNFRATAFHAVILHEQLKALEGRIDRYGKNVEQLRRRLVEVPGLRIQMPGRLASPQGYYGLVILFDREPLAEVPLLGIIQALKAEGLNVGKTYGPVYRHQLYNMTADTFRIEGGSCPVAEMVGTERAVVLSHPWLDSEKQIIDVIGNIFEKVAVNAEALKGLE